MGVYPRSRPKIVALLQYLRMLPTAIYCQIQEGKNIRCRLSTKSHHSSRNVLAPERTCNNLAETMHRCIACNHLVCTICMIQYVQCAWCANGPMQCASDGKPGETVFLKTMFPSHRLATDSRGIGNFREGVNERK